MRTYSELSSIPSFIERYRYLRLGGIIGEETFGYDRWLNQKFYKSSEWRHIRHLVILRDNGCDLGCPDQELSDFEPVIIHHMNPITMDDIINRSPILLDPEYLITVGDDTHKAIHYGDESLLNLPPVERYPNDTCPWSGVKRRSNHGEYSIL